MKSKKSNQEYDCNQDTIKDINERIKNRNSWAVIGIGILFSFVIAYKLICIDFSEMHIELSSLLSFAVAFFAVFLYAFAAASRTIEWYGYFHTLSYNSLP